MKVSHLTAFTVVVTFQQESPQGDVVTVSAADIGIRRADLIIFAQRVRPELLIITPEGTLCMKFTNGLPVGSYDITIAGQGWTYSAPHVVEVVDATDDARPLQTEIALTATIPVPGADPTPARKVIPSTGKIVAGRAIKIRYPKPSGLLYYFRHAIKVALTAEDLRHTGPIVISQQLIDNFDPWISIGNYWHRLNEHPELASISAEDAEPYDPYRVVIEFTTAGPMFVSVDDYLNEGENTFLFDVIAMANDMLDGTLHPNIRHASCQTTSPFYRIRRRDRECVKPCALTKEGLANYLLAVEYGDYHSACGYLPEGFRGLKFFKERKKKKIHGFEHVPGPMVVSMRPVNLSTGYYRVHGIPTRRAGQLGWSAAYERWFIGTPNPDRDDWRVEKIT